MEKIKEIIIKEKKALKALLSLLEKQHRMIVEKDVFGLEALVDEIKKCNKDVAVIEIERRKVLQDKNMNQFVEESNDEEMKSEFKNVKNLLQSIKLQKETNEVLIRQKMSYNNQMLRIINPDREIKTYNSYGNLRK